ncbi:MAG: hypothetical protein K6F28_09085 [Lachnospiraceae bacterium]|nr:hypothetical protein [Lachnospiraceae bacterium]
MDNREMEKKKLNEEELEITGGGPVIHQKYNNSGLSVNESRYRCPQHPEGGEHEYESLGHSSSFWMFSFDEEMYILP